MEAPKEVLILTGPCGIGKTTTAIAWAKAKGGAVVDGDVFTTWMQNSKLPKWGLDEEHLVARQAVHATFEYLLLDMPVAIDYVFAPNTIEAIRSNMFRMGDLKVKVVRLMCDLEENQKRDAQRIPDHQMKERVAIVAKELDEHKWPSNYHQLDTTNMTVEEVVEKIETLE